MTKPGMTQGYRTLAWWVFLVLATWLLVILVVLGAVSALEWLGVLG